MWRIALVLVSCCLFIHLDMGDTIRKILHTDFILLRCVKCLTFWAVLGYSLLCLTLPTVTAIGMAFLCAYASLWIDLLLGKMAEIYEKLGKDVDAEEPKSDSGIGSETDKDSKGEKS